MSISFFRPRDRFDFSKDTLDIGNPISWKRAHFKKHFFKRVFAIHDWGFWQNWPADPQLN